MSIAITQVRNAKSLQADNARMEVEIKHPQYGWIPYGVDPSDTDNTVDNKALMALIGTDFTAYVAPTAAEVEVALAASVRAGRNSALAATDYMGLADYPAKVGELEYRQALRDVPQQAGFPHTHVWPTKPGTV